MNVFCIRPFPGVAAAVALLAGLAAPPLQAQQGTLAGQVTDQATQQAIAGAQVLVEGTNLEARTSREGHYTITRVPAAQYRVQVRLIGYATATSLVTVAAGSAATLDFALSAAAVPLDAVVVSATGETQLARELGNNIGRVNADSVTREALPVNAADLLNSRVPGVEVEQSGGTTGTGSRIRIRGAASLSLRNEPTIVVDGVRIDNTANADGGIGVGGQAPSRINDLNAEDIQTIEVIKGPSASSLYGTDAANGVIQITTKRGQPGPTRWGAYIEGGTLNDETSWPANYRSTTASGASCPLASMAAGACTIANVTSYNPLIQNPPFREGVRQHYGVNASGGTEITTFYLSGDFQREKGIYESNDLKKTTLHANLTNQVSRLMDLAVTANYVSSNLALPQNDNNNQGIVSSGLLGFPSTRNGGYRFLTPAQANLVSTTQRIERFTGGMTLNFRPWSFLTMRGTGGYDLTNQGDNELTPPNVVLLSPGQQDGNVFQYRAQIFSYTAQYVTEASFRLSPVITSKTSVGVQFFKEAFQQVRASGRKVVAGCSTITCAVFPTVGDTTAPFVTLGAYVAEQVALRDRLYVNGSVRGDRNSSFGTTFKTIYYPKLSASYVISDEPFFPRLSWLSSLRVRAAWGESGRAPGPLDALHFYSPVAVAANGTDVAGVTIGAAGNDSLKPERSREFEGGFDADLFQQRVHFEVTGYDKDSKDALVAVPIAPSVGQGATGGTPTTRLANLGEVTNKGIEVLLTAQVINTPNLSWSITASAWGNRNRVISVGPDTTPIIFGLGGATQRHENGYPAGSYWGTPYTFQDKNGDGLIDPATEITYGTHDVFQGSSIPTHGGTISTEVNFLRHFSFHGLLDGRFGNKLDNATEGFRCLFAICAGTRVPGTSLADQAAAQAALLGIETGYFQDAGFVKLRELSITYSAPSQWASRIGASTLSFTVVGRNLATWTSYRGVDPEVNVAGQFNFNVAEFLTQPPVRYFIGRVNVTF